MSRRLGLTLLAMGLALAPKAFAQSAAPAAAEPAIKVLKWPGINDMAFNYPDRALQEHSDGVVRLGCDIDPQGRLINCGVFGEYPQKAGFGAASLKVMPKFLVQDNESVGANSTHRFVFTIYWRPPNATEEIKPNFDVGSNAGLLTGPDLKGDATPTAGLRCLNPTPGHECKFHGLTWDSLPDPKANGLAVLRYGTNHDVDILVCRVTPQQRLTACQASSAEIAAVTHDLLPGFKVPKTADDGAPIGEGPVAIMVDWPAIWRAAKAYAPDTPDPVK